MDSALKQRLLGAAVLIALAIIFVPMFFSTTPPKPENTNLIANIPPAPERNFETRNLSVDAGGTALRSTPGDATTAAAPVADGNKLATVTTGAPPTFEAGDTQRPDRPDNAVSTATLPTPSASLPGAKLAPAAPPPSASVQSDGRFMVNLGIYSDSGHAEALVGRIKKLGFPGFSEVTQYQGKAAQRVRVGPYADRAAAESIRLKIKQSEGKVPSSVVEISEPDKALIPAQSAKVSATPIAANGTAPVAATHEPVATLAANRAGGYAVQLGAFKSEEEANKLRDRVRNGGFPAFIDKSLDGEQALWKVRVGPYADRSGADTALNGIKQKLQVTGIIKTRP